MTLEKTNPAGLPVVDSYRQVAIATGSRMVFTAGQVSVNADGDTVAVGDLAGQIEQCYVNVATALNGAGATFDDVGKITVYVVDLTPDKMPLFAQGMQRAAARLGVEIVAPMTGIGVSALASPDYLCEIEATAVLA